MTKTIPSLILLAAAALAAPALAADPPNLAEIVQSGLASTATLTQQGSGDLMSIVQMGGNGNDAREHLQLGSGLAPVGIVQQGGAAVTVIQSR